METPLKNDPPPVERYSKRLYSLFCLVLVLPLVILAFVMLNPDRKLSHLAPDDLVVFQTEVFTFCVTLIVVSWLSFRLLLRWHVRRILDGQRKLTAYVRVYALRLSFLFVAGLAAVTPVMLMPDQYAYNVAGFALLLILLALIASQPTAYVLEKHLRLSGEAPTYTRKRRAVERVKRAA